MAGSLRIPPKYGPRGPLGRLGAGRGLGRGLGFDFGIT